MHTENRSIFKADQNCSRDWLASTKATVRVTEANLRLRLTILSIAASMLNTFSMQLYVYWSVFWTQAKPHAISAYFYWYSFVRTGYIDKFYPGVAAAAVTLSTAAELSLGALAGAISQVFTIPVSVVATRQQLSPPDQSLSLYDTAADILKEDGITGLWRGLKASLVLTVVRRGRMSVECRGLKHLLCRIPH